ncbi:PAS domain-containing protein [Streptomyces albofaciens JCM 4342]|uniref:hybrid sensor histidine kinase/response regulator n=1 Tax=Streptomyces albofaciens TaxID=66866 RepID=UPI00123AC194|nr:PAS domain-containing protein [Streptomyces albofaciens]KAA6215115.1 PAS domain-containing protein [Streptomyces albofaciens JCM 4342]
MSSRPSRGAARLAAILDALPDALLLVNCNGTVVNANAIALETFEAPGTALVGRGLLDLLPAFDSKRIPGSMRRRDEEDQGPRTKPTRMVARRTDGSELLVEVTSANLEDGRTPYESAFEAAYADHRNGYTGDELLMLVVRDLTGTLDTETELARQQRQTEMILRAAAEGVVGVDSEGKVVLVNPSAAQILGYRASELGGKELHPLIHHSRADGTPLPWEETPLADSLRSGRKHRVRGQALWAKDGRSVPVDLTTAPVRDGDQLVGAVMTFTDRRPYDALAARHAQLLAVLDQSLRGPLEELKAELGTLASDPAGQLWPEANQILHHLAAGYARMTTLVDNVLSYQRLDAGGERLERDTVSLDAVVAAGVEGAIELIGPGRAQFAVHAPPIDAEVDPVRLAQALSHLIADVAGVDATGKAGGGGSEAASGDSTIVVAAAQRGEVVRIEVRGPYGGGNPVHAPIVRGIVRQHGGVLQTHEVPGAGGSAYVLEVPVSASGAPVSGAAGADRAREATGNETTVMPVPAERARGTQQQGEKKTQGAQGAQGAQGTQGAQGAQGAPGSVGAGRTDSEGEDTPTGRRRARRGDVPVQQQPGEGTATAGDARGGGAGQVPRARSEADAAGAQGPVPGSGGTGPGGDGPTGAAPGGPGMPQGTAGMPQGMAGAEVVPPGGRRRAQDAPEGAERTALPAVAGIPQGPGQVAHGGPAQGGQAQGGQVQGGPVQGGPAQGGPAQGGPAQGGPAHGGQVQGGQVQPTGRRARRTLADAAERPIPNQPQAAQAGVRNQNSAFALPPAAADQLPQSPLPALPVLPGQAAGPHGGGGGGVGVGTGAGTSTGTGPGAAVGTGTEASPGTGRRRARTAAPGAVGEQAAVAADSGVPEGDWGAGPTGRRRARRAAAEERAAAAMADSESTGTFVAGPEGLVAHPMEDGPVAGPVAAAAAGEGRPVPTGRRRGRPSPAEVEAGEQERGQQERGQQVPGQQVPGQQGEPQAQPGDPARPGQPGHPAQPGHSGSAGHPVQPNQHAQSGQPAQPGQPDVLGTPGSPGAPGTPGAPQQPVPDSATSRRPLATPASPEAAGDDDAADGHAAGHSHGRAFNVRTLGQGVPFSQQIADQQRPAAPGTPAAGAPAPGTPAPGSGRRRKLAQPPQDAERAADAAEARPHPQPGAHVPGQAAQPHPAPQAQPQQQPPHQQSQQPQQHAQNQQPPQQLQHSQHPQQHLLNSSEGRAFAVSAPDEGSEGPEPLDGPNGAVEVTEPQPQPMDDELPPEPLDNPRRLLVWPAPDVSTQQALSDRGYRPVIVNSREEVDAQIAAYPAALFVDPLTGPITRTALQSLRTAAVAAEVPVLVTAGLGQATREAAYGADPAVLLKALAPRDSEQHPPRVLLTEENDAVAGALTTSLERRGMQVARAATDADAVNLAAQMRPNLVVMDLMQVRRRRAGIVDWLRSNGLLNRTPLVVYTSADLDPAQLPRLAAGETVLFLAERSTSAEVQSRIVDLLAKIGTN